ncbi:Mrp/NBP35 family ATP-binding protein [Kiritimatiella glycovorans]|uniref:Iron-sulfur cluster carrier protein n=1 Tax=Kiritimatiella glycovorans TaxID=1307763 RepID=A0A0G3EKD9_9BACT|nr:Mrp/NBP35 family ATP-binding protein [Kiritimatiella glycovorans]AKJ65285.1 Cell division inhibitor MinD [Kiritimatiella glycovorans]
MSEENACDGCPSAASGECDGAQADPQEMALKCAMARIRHKVLVLSGKGGVGKSTVAANLAAALSKDERVGLLDADLHGPSVPRLFNLSGSQVLGSEGRILPVPVTPLLHVMSIGFLLEAPETPVIWRGPRKLAALRQFLSEVDWDEREYLIVDCPPGTGDEPLGVIQTIGEVSGAVIVTTPQELALEDVRKSVSFCRQLETPVLGVVENMSGFACPNCGEVSPIFEQGGGEEMAQQMNVPFLGRIPIDPGVVRACDRGELTRYQQSAGSASARAFDEVREALKRNLSSAS